MPQTDIKLEPAREEVDAEDGDEDEAGDLEDGGAEVHHRVVLRGPEIR